jgi:uncharacterized DUF497 family protein
MRQFRWNQEKNLKLAEERGISFETVVYAIHKGDVIEVLDHPNSDISVESVILLTELTDEDLLA